MTVFLHCREVTVRYNGNRLHIEFEVFEMRLVLPIEVRTGADRSSSVHAGSSSRWVATSRLGIEGVRLHNRSWAGCWELLRVAASSNYSSDCLRRRFGHRPTGADSGTFAQCGRRLKLSLCNARARGDCQR